VEKKAAESSGRFSRRAFKCAAGILALLCCFGCQRRERPEKFVLITLDTQRADYISAYDPAKASTPNIDALAGEGIVFRNAYSLIPITLPAHAVIFFSEPPCEVKNYNNGEKIGLRRSRPSLVNLFRREGFSTAAFVSLGVLESHYGLDQGFEVYQDTFPPDRWYLSAGEVNEKLLPWLDQNAARPFFLWVHYSDPHDPYATPSAPQDFKLFLNGELVYETSLQKYLLNHVILNLRPGKNRLRLGLRNEFDSNPEHFLGRLDLVEFSPPSGTPGPAVDYQRGWFIRRPDNVYFFTGNSEIVLDNPGGPIPVRFTFRGKPLLSVSAARACYRREVEYMDAEIGRLWSKLRELRLEDKTALLIVGDHGEGLGEYNNDFGDPHVGHIHFLYDVYLKIPLIIRFPPRLNPGAREEFVSLLDIAPTISRIMGFKPLPHFLGRDLLRSPIRQSGVIFQETYRPESTRDRFGLLSHPWHLIFTPEEKRFEIFNLAADPQEKLDLYKAAGEFPAATLPLKLEIEDAARKALGARPQVQVDDKTREMLKALGYIR